MATSAAGPLRHQTQSRSWRPPLFGMRRACDECGRRKKKCDGFSPCSGCTKAGRLCTYSKRKWHLPPSQKDQKQQQQSRDGGQSPRPVLMNSTSGALLACGVLPFKRIRLSASPATGLVGMQENGFLSDFFGCIGFLPLATQSNIRGSMVRIMLAADPHKQAGVGKGCREGWRLDAIAGGVDLCSALDGRRLPMDPSSCIFWCAVAVGALVRGSPIETVESYSQLATEALASHNFDPADAEVARAWAILAYLHDLMGDSARFGMYHAQAGSCYAAVLEQGSIDNAPVGFTELIKSQECFSTDDAGEPPPQLNGAASEAEVYRYVMRSFKAFEQAVAAKMVEGAVDCGPPVGNDKPADDDVTGPSDPRFQSLRLLPGFDQQLADAMVSVWGKIDFGPLEEIVNRGVLEGGISMLLKQVQHDFTCLSSATSTVLLLRNRSSIGSGVGSMIINGTLVFDTASTGDVHGTLRILRRCVDVIERYPGLCRSAIWCHRAHAAMAALAGLDVSGTREVYERLRATYNPCRPCGSSPVPPLEEWQGVSSICEDVTCRALERVIASEEMRAFRTPFSDICPSEGGGNTSERIFNPGDQSEANSASARSVAEEESFRQAPFPSERRISRAVSSVRGRVDDPSETPLMMSQGPGEGVVEDADEYDVGAADWLDVTHGLLDVVHDPGLSGS